MAYEEIVQQYYVGFYGRPADVEGLAYWSEQLEASGGDFTAIQNAFANSQEYMDFVLREDGVPRTNDELVNFIYNNLFGRDAETEGLNFWVDHLEAGNLTLIDIVTAVIEGAQGTDATAFANKVAVATYFTDWLGEVPYTGDDIPEARALLAGVTEDPATVTEGQDAANDLIGDMGGQEFQLTTSLDSLEGTIYNDTFQGTLGEPAYTTFNTGDVVDGSTGKDTFILSAFDNLYQSNVAEISDVENFVVRNFDPADDLTLNAGAWTGVESYAVKGGLNGVYIENVQEAFSTVTIENFGVGESDYDELYIEVANSVFTGDADEVTIMLNNVGAQPIPRRLLDNDSLGGGSQVDGEYAWVDIYNANDDGVVEIFNVVSTGDNPRGNFVHFDSGSESMTELNISGDVDLRIALSGYAEDLATVDASALDANLFLRGICVDSDYTVIGAQGDNDIRSDYAEGDHTITTFAGNDTIHFDYGSNTIDSGDGNDFIHTGCNDYQDAALNWVYDNTVNAGAGDDIVQVGDSLNAGDSIDGGDGYDTIWMHVDLAVAATAAADGKFEALFDNFEAVKLSNIDETATVNMAYLDDIQNVVLGYQSFALGEVLTLKGLTDGASLEYDGRIYGDGEIEVYGAGSLDLVLNGEGDGGDGSVLNTAGTDYIDNEAILPQEFNILTLHGVTELNISTATRCQDFDLTDADGTKDGIDISFIDFAIDVDATDETALPLPVNVLENVTVTGEISLNLDLSDQIVDTTIDASTFDAGLVLTSGSGDDTITVGDGANYIVGGLGLDTMTGGEGVDIYAYSTVAESQGITVDVITNFEGGATGDKLDFSALAIVGAGPGTYVGEATGYGAVLTELTAGTAKAVLDSDTSILYVDVDASGTLDDLDMAIQLTGVTGLVDTAAASNFIWV